MSNCFTPNTIYAALYRRMDSRYHWAMILAEGPENGYKLHATNIPDPAEWHYEREVYSIDNERKPLVLMAKIGCVPADMSIAEAESILGEIPMETPQPDSPHPFTCRIWFREGIRRLSAAGLMQCVSVNALEYELVDIADDHSNLVALGLRPWKLHEEIRSVH
ncbi:uncharacterized protein C8Q71DRAFT_786059 [Rhodofomes roseus]|uniref:Uncharacterized protein n=1 Tax=Rhodofomes roseus TaxID=34475 RepID=A0ABQ8K1X2_9APHY|nr:uncharacterized protein C8Q71DRAFT_786059 [Rhodofomes roseus]KAH9830496.1 hypothetical protein C8Q71DRAFT_786059 [Rhodofomes roseus]